MSGAAFTDPVADTDTVRSGSRSCARETSVMVRVLVTVKEMSAARRRREIMAAGPVVGERHDASSIIPADWDETWQGGAA